MNADSLKYLSVNLCLMMLLISGCQTADQNPPPIGNTANLPQKNNSLNPPKSPKKPKFVSKVNTISEDPIDDADAVYEGNENIPEGVYIYQKLVFVVVAVDLRKQHQIEPEGVAMLRERRLLQNKFKLPETFSITRSVIQNEENDDGTFYRYVTVYRKSDILQLTGK